MVSNDLRFNYEIGLVGIKEFPKSWLMDEYDLEAEVFERLANQNLRDSGKGGILLLS